RTCASRLPARTEDRPMADQPIPFRTDAELEAALRELGGAIDWPSASPGDAGAGPDLAAVVRSRIEAGEAPRPSRLRDAWSSWRPVRRVLVVAVVALLALAILAAIAGAAGLGLPGLRISLGPPPVSPPPTLAPSPVRSPAGVPGAGMHLGEQVALSDLDA